MPAIIFDCDGVLADTERFGHLIAFNQTFREFNLPVQWSEADYAIKLRIAGGKERMASLLTTEFVNKANLPLNPSAQKELISNWHQRKTDIYMKMVSEGKLPGRPGIVRLIDEAITAGWKLAVASTSAEQSVRAVLENVAGENRAAQFEILAGDIVSRKKPAADIYLLALKQLKVAANQALVIEDSRNGLLAAVSAGLRCLITLSSYTKEEDMSEAILVVSDLGEGKMPMQVLENRSRARPGDFLTLKDLEACLFS
jgi:HAD superfamily hydrolase (TIGR01509 family)